MPVRNLQQPDIMKGLLVSLLLTGFCQAVRVYLHPEAHVPPRLSAVHAGAVLSQHLGLERFEEASPFLGEQELLFGQGQSAGILVRISSEDVKGMSLVYLKCVWSSTTRE